MVDYLVQSFNRIRNNEYAVPVLKGVGLGLLVSEVGYHSLNFVLDGFLEEIPAARTTPAVLMIGFGGFAGYLIKKYDNSGRKHD